MSLKMQGTWCITTKSKASNHPLYLVITGADRGNGVYEINLNRPPISVTGQEWQISIRRDSEIDSINLSEKIHFPYKLDNKYQFDIECLYPDSQNQCAATLSCSKPQTTCDFIIYGEVSTYDKPCFFNPFYHFYIALETREAFFEALKYDPLRLAIKKLYLDRLSEEILISPLERSTTPFKPILIPIQDESIIPPSLGQVLNIRCNSNKNSDKLDQNNNLITIREIFTLIRTKKPKIEIDRQALVYLHDKVLPRSITEPLPEIEFQCCEYIRTCEEFQGGPFSGEGKRKKIGSCTSDRFGNYIFNFSKSENPHLESSLFNLKLNKDCAFQFMPDILIQLCNKENNEVIHETVPYWNVPLFKRINICFPKKKLAALEDIICDEDDINLSESDAELILV